MPFLRAFSKRCALGLLLLNTSLAWAEPYVFRSTEPQEMTVVSQGSLSLQKRLDMINNAKHTIEAEFFIYSIDEAGRLVTQALIRKAQQGLHVRLLVDYGLPIAKLDPYFATKLVASGLDVRYYNPALSFELLRGQFRSHRKSLIVDDEIAVTGGRNVADEYFELNEKYDFLDRDIFVRGTMAKAVRESFDKFWSSNMTSAPKTKDLPTPERYGIPSPEFNSHEGEDHYKADLQTFIRKMTDASSYVTENDHDREILKSLAEIQAREGSKLKPRICRDSIFAADMPGIGEKSRVLYEEIRKQLLEAKSRIDIESPYFVMRIDGETLMSDILRKKVQLNLYSNSLYSTDAIYTTATFYPRIGFLIEKGMNVYIYRGHSLPDYDYVTDKVRDTRWGIHAKSAVIDGKDIMVGTFNADPRSHNINAEMAIMCRGNQELAQDVLVSMEQTREASVQLNKFGEPVGGGSKYFGVSPFKRLEYYILAPESNLFDFLL